MSATTKSTRAKALRFAMVGVINTLFGYAVFAALTRLGCRDVYAVPGAMAAGALFNFVSYGKLVFRSLDRRRFPRFAAAYLAIYFCNVGVLRLFGRFGLGPYVSQAVVIVPLAVLAYVLNDRWVYRGV